MTPREKRSAAKGRRKATTLRRGVKREVGTGPWPKGVFGGMSGAELSEMAGMAGRLAHSMGKAHEFTREEARKAALKSWIKRRKQQ